MTTRALTDLLAKKARVRRSAAAEQVSRMVHDILTTLRQGEPAKLPGLGRFEPGPTPKFYFEGGIISSDTLPLDGVRQNSRSPIDGETDLRGETAESQCESVIREVHERDGDAEGRAEG